MDKRPYPTKPFLTVAFDAALRGVRECVAGLTDDEYFWEPVPHCWSVRRRSESKLADEPYDVGGALRAGNEWMCEWTDHDERPTTIAWLLTHMAGAKQRYHDFLFEGGERGHLIPTTAADAIAFYEDSHARLARRLDALDDAQLQEVRMSIWRVEEPLWWTYWVAFTHDMSHGAEIGRLRALHRG